MKLYYASKKEIDRILGLPVDFNQKLKIVSDICRLNAVSSIKQAGSGHLGSSLSSLDIFIFLYFKELNLHPTGLKDPHRDIFFSSKGHDVPGQYAAMVAAGFLEHEKLKRLRRLDGLDGHPDTAIWGMEANTGSLGMGISKARGMAFAKKLNGWGGRVIVLTGDGELQEGQIWESLQTTAHQKASSVHVIVDANKVQTDRYTDEITCLGNLEKKFESFGWYVERCNGHSFEAMEKVFLNFKTVSDRPKILIADTIKGKGISFMEHPRDLSENNGIYGWHSGAPDEPSYLSAAQELISKINGELESLQAGPLQTEILELDTAAPNSTPVERVVSAYGEALAELGKKRSDVIVLDGDLAADCGLVEFQKTFPDRFIENGIAEQDMVSMAGGLALQGFLPIVHSFGVFLASRANEQIYNNATEGTKIIYTCNYSGLIPAGPGKSHQSVRDISLFGALPNCIAIEPCNAEETKRALEWCVEQAKENCLLRLAICPSPREISLPKGYSFTFGKGVVLKEGNDGILFSYGPVMLNEALVASDLLKGKNFSLKVVNMPWLNRVNKSWVRRIVKNFNKVFVLENHSSYGGLGDCLLNSVSSCENLQIKRFEKLAIEKFPACGAPHEVLKYHKLDGESIASRIYP